MNFLFKQTKEILEKALVLTNHLTNLYKKVYICTKMRLFTVANRCIKIIIFVIVACTHLLRV